ncbi:MAG TPA: ElyC/SanA/YdcF family protein [Polyangia bacterium]|nr:ElyC/SanA/YdcF family protein [Polyangia bacterium]
MAEPASPGRSGSPAWRKRLWLAILLGAGLTVAGNAYVLGTTRAAMVATVAEAPARPFVIVLGNRVLPDGRPSRELAARLETGRQLYAEGRARKIIVSGLAQPDYDEPHSMASWLYARGVPTADVILDLGGYRTAATMADAAAMGVRSALVATQAYHLPRALYLARHAGIDAVGVPSVRSARSVFDAIRTALRETLARAESIVEVAFRGVRA